MPATARSTAIDPPVRARGAPPLSRLLTGVEFEGVVLAARSCRTAGWRGEAAEAVSGAPAVGFSTWFVPWPPRAVGPFSSAGVTTDRSCAPSTLWSVGL